MIPTTSSEKTKQTHGKPDTSEFQSINLALDEIRRRYDDEEQRRSSVDNKSIGLGSLDAVIISVMSISSDTQTGLFTVLVLLLLTISIILALVNIRRQTYHRPFSQTGHIYAYADDPAPEFNSQVLNLYIICVSKNEKINDKNIRFSRLDFC